MKIFGIEFTTKKELKEKIAHLECFCEGFTKELRVMRETFPFKVGQIVYDVALKDEKGRYTKTNPSIEHSTITPVIVDEKNYFKLVARYRRNDVFVDLVSANDYLDSVCD
jgi:hypothetical protein